MLASVNSNVATVLVSSSTAFPGLVKLLLLSTVSAPSTSSPWGTTSTYGALCDTLGLPATSARAVGRALAVNPLHILIPCHRFLVQDGKLHGFAAGLSWKEDLLRLEGAIL